MTINVVHVTQGLDVGGQEKLLVEFARHADRSLFTLHFVSLSTHGPMAAELEATGWPVTALQSGQGIRPELVLRLARLFVQLRTHVVHTHDERPNIYAGPAAWLAGAKSIHTRHSQASKLTRRQRWIVRVAAEFNDVFACISADSAMVARRHGISRRRLRVVPNGIDLSRFSFCGPNPRGPAVLVARLAPEKDVGTLLDAVALLGSRCPDFQLVIAGDGPCRAALEARAATLGQRVRFLGVVHEVPSLLSQARLFVLSSITEGLSLTLLEAMATGLPVVATNVGGNPEVISDGKTGILVPPRNSALLADALAWCWTRPETCARMGREARRRVEEQFDIRHMIAAYEHLYTLDQPRPSCRAGAS
ncbi:MAG: glycosyltransferase [Planctomycetia bacterium]|nr:glycosyltransferase [Planctomycetia bacterium]